jgi:hypothetical protein
MSVSSAVRVFSPAVGTWALQRYGFGSIGASGCVLLLGLLLVVECCRSSIAPPSLALHTAH